MLGADVVVVHAAPLIHRELNDLLGARGEANHAEHDAVGAADDAQDGVTDGGGVHAQVAQDDDGHTFALADEAKVWPSSSCATWAWTPPPSVTPSWASSAAPTASCSAWLASPRAPRRSLSSRWMRGAA